MRTSMIQSFCALILAACAPCALAMPAGIAVNQKGHLELNGIQGTVQYLDSAWKPTFHPGPQSRALPGYPVYADQFFETQSEMTVPDGVFQIEETLREQSGQSARYRIVLRNQEGIRGKALGLNFSLPHKEFRKREIMIDGKAYPADADSGLKRGVKELSMIHRGNKLTFRGKFDVMIEDKGKKGWDFATLWFPFSPSSGLLKEASLTFDIFVEPVNATLMNPETVEGAVKGGDGVTLAKQWGLPSGTLTAAQQRFPMPEWRRRRGGLLLIPRGESRTWTLPADRREGKFFCLVHGVDSDAAVPEVTVAYPDGKSETVKLQPGKDFCVANPLEREANYAVVASSSVDRGVGYSLFRLKGTPEKVTFANRGTGNWLVAGAGIAEAALPTKSVPSITVISQNDLWVPFENMKMPEAGSVLDFSGDLDAPAGKYGWIKVTPDGHFAPEQRLDKRIKFLGTNFALSSVYLEKEEADRAAEEIARLGYNTVRLHPERELTPGKAKSALDFDDAQRDRVDYFYSVLKNKGIYFILDLHGGRLRENDMPDLVDRKASLKALMPILPAARDHWKAYARKMLDHRNPYTGLTWVEDPAFFALILNNEDDVYTIWNSTPYVEKLYLDGYRAYLEERKMLTPENLKSRGGVFLRYLAHLYADMIRDYTSFLRNELGYKGLITDFNFRSRYIDNAIRNELDFVDNHCYWDHPRFLPGRNWATPYLHNQASVLRAMAWNPRDIISTRIFGKPFILSEVNNVFPNHFRAESGPILGAIAAMQDWDGIYNFAWSHDRAGVLHQRPVNRFDISQDALMQISEKILFLMYKHGAVSPAKEAYGWEFGEESFRNVNNPNDARYPAAFQQLGLFARTGSIPANSALPGIRRITSNGAQLERELDDAAKRFLQAEEKTSVSGELSIHAGKGTFRVTAPRIESLTVHGGSLAGNVMRLADADSFQVVTLAALDGKPLAGSARLLLFHQSDLTNDGIKFQSETHQGVLDWGANRQLIRRATARLELALGAGEYRIQAIGLNGLPKGTVEAEKEENKLRIPLDTTNFGGTMIYLIEKR